MRNKSEKEVEVLAKAEPECTALVRAPAKLKRLRSKRKRGGSRSSMEMVAFGMMAYYALKLGEEMGLNPEKEKPEE